MISSDIFLDPMQGKGVDNLFEIRALITSFGVICKLCLIFLKLYLEMCMNAVQGVMKENCM